MRKATTFTISNDILDEISASKGEGSTSERVNHLLRRALDLERHERLEQQAADFFSHEGDESLKERAAFQKATRKTLARD